MIHQESLFFALPFFFVTTAWNSGQALFTSLLGAAALIAILDPLYYKWLAARRWLYLSFHSLALFAVLLVALPLIVHLTTAESYRLALGITLVVTLPSLGSSLRIKSFWRWTTLAGLVAALGVGAWLARPWVPPATLWLTEVAVTSQLQARNPGRSLEQVASAQLQQAGLYAYTAISAPRGLNERIYHVWKRNGVEMDRIALDIHGGRKAGYRAWTHKRNFPGQPAGDWQVQVVTEAGQQIGVLRFRVD
jgi:signal transduction histidine kinase